MGALVRAGGGESPAVRNARSRMAREDKAVVDVDFSADAPYDASYST